MIIEKRAAHVGKARSRVASPVRLVSATKNAKIRIAASTDNGVASRKYSKTGRRATGAREVLAIRREPREQRRDGKKARKGTTERGGGDEIRSD